MKRKYLAFDIETAKQLPAGERDWKTHRPLGISCAATLTGDSGELLLWHELTGAGPKADLLAFTGQGQDYLVVVPEPATVLLLGLGGTISLLRRKRSRVKYPLRDKATYKRA